MIMRKKNFKKDWREENEIGKRIPFKRGAGAWMKYGCRTDLAQTQYRISINSVYTQYTLSID